MFSKLRSQYKRVDKITIGILDGASYIVLCFRFVSRSLGCVVRCLLRVYLGRTMNEINRKRLSDGLENHLVMRK